MRTFHFQREITVARTLDDVFAFFSDPHNLEALTPPWLHFRIESLSTPTVGVGTEIHYALKLRGIPIRWTSRIPVWEPPRRFVDEQIRGPYRLWRHLHTFEARGEGTLVRDQVEYAPLGGWLADRLIVRRDLERIFDYRQARLTDLLDTRTASAMA